MFAGRGVPAWVGGTALVASLSLVGGLAVAAVAADVVEIPITADPSCPTQASSEDAAVALARECGVEVEVTSARTEWNTLYARPDGAMRVVASAGAVRTRVSGQWDQIDNSLVATENGFEVVSAVAPMTFSDGGQGSPLAAIERDGQLLSLDVEFDLPTPLLSAPNQLTYPEVIPGVDVIVTVDPDATGFTEVLRVASAQAAADPRLDLLTFPVSTSPDLGLEQVGGGFSAVAGDGEEVFRSAPPLMWDSGPTAGSLTALTRTTTTNLFTADTQASAEADAFDQPASDPAVAPAGDATVTELSVQLDDAAVSLEPDAAMLADPDTTWPVYIDPPISATRMRWAEISDHYATHYMQNADEVLGYCDQAMDWKCPSNYKSRLMWMFSGLGDVGSVTSAEVLSATFAVEGVHSWDCTPRAVTLYRTVDFDGAVGWPGGTLWDPLSTQTVAHKNVSECPTQPSRTIEFDATGQARAIADANTEYGSLGLATNETSMLYWKRYQMNTATFSVTYNRAPSTPTSAKMTNTDPDRVCGGRPPVRTQTPTLNAVLSDPDRGNLQGQFQMWNAATGELLWTSGLTAAQASGSNFNVVLPTGKLPDGGIYQWRAWARDEYGVTGPYIACEFVADRTAPATPAVTPLPGDATTLPSGYLENAWSGGLGVTGAFRLTDSSTDVASYLYSFDNTAIINQAPEDTAKEILPPGSTRPPMVIGLGTYTVRLTPTVTGLHTLRVVAIDQAGNPSAVRTYKFMVNFASVIGQWQLDDDDDGLAADTSGVSTPHPLTLATQAWVSGLLRERDPDAADHAVQFAELGDAAHTVGPVFHTDAAFAVMATVRLDATGAIATAVSADSVHASGFELGYRTTGCPQGMSGCWAFAMNGADTDTATATVAASTMPVVAGRWVHLTGVFTTTGIQVYACDLGTATDPGLQDPQGSAVVPRTPTFIAAADFTVGRGQVASAPAHPWVGAVGDVKALLNAPDIADVRMACQSPS